MNTTQEQKLLTCCIHQNNHGASCIENRDYIESIEILTNALRCFNQNAKNKQGQQAHLQMRDECCDCCLDHWIHRGTATARSSHDKENNADRMTGFICQRTLQVPTTESADNVMIPIAIISNLALAHLMYAVEEANHQSYVGGNTSLCLSETRQMLLKKAGRLYEAALNLHRSVGEQDGDAVHDCAFFSMSIANNLGQIHRLLNNKDKSEGCFRRVLSLLMFVVDFHQQRGIESEHNDEGQIPASDLDGFFRNTQHLMFSSKHVVLAASAA